MAITTGSAIPPIYPRPNPIEPQTPGIALPSQESPAPVKEEDRIEISEGLGNREQREGRRRIRNYESQEVRQFPSFDETVTFKEKVLEEGGEEVLLSVSITKEQIQLNPEKAAQAQAGLNPQRLLKLLED